jgi:hypothetical protein
MTHSSSASESAVASSSAPSSSVKEPLASLRLFRHCARSSASTNARSSAVPLAGGWFLSYVMWQRGHVVTWSRGHVITRDALCMHVHTSTTTGNQCVNKRATSACTPGRVAATAARDGRPHYPAPGNMIGSTTITEVIGRAQQPANAPARAPDHCSASV